VSEAQRIASKSYAALSSQLGEHQWLMHQSSPSSIDCVVVGHLMEVLVDCTSLGTIVVNKYPNLLSYCERVRKELKWSEIAAPAHSNVPIWGEEELEEKIHEEILDESSKTFVGVTIGIVTMYLLYTRLQ